MIRKFKTIITVLASLAILLLPAAPVLAAGTDPFGEICKTGGTSSSTVCQDKTTTNPITGPNGLIIKVTRILAVVAGAVAIIMIIVSGLRLILSDGDKTKATQARGGLIYSVVGLLVIIAAQSIISFVIDRIYN